MTPKTSNAPTLKTTTDLSALTHEIAKSVATGADTGASQSKRSKHVEKAKVQQLTKQLAMRLQYAKLKVDHGWSRQNLDEVENLYFHHYRDRRPDPTTSQPKPPQRRIGAAPFPSSSSSSTGAPPPQVQAAIAGPSGSQQSTTPSQSTGPSTAITQPNIVVDNVPDQIKPPAIGYDPSVNSVGEAPSASSSLPQPSGSTSIARSASSPHPISRTNRQASRSHPYASLTTLASSSSLPTIPPSPQKLSPKKAGKAPVRGGGSNASGKSLGKASSKTSIPSTLQSPQIAESTTAARLAQVMGNKPAPGATGSTSATVTTTSSFAGPTSYESFWNQLGSGGLAARTLASSPSKTTTGDKVSGGPALSTAASGSWNGTPTTSIAPASQSRPPPPASAAIIPPAGGESSTTLLPTSASSTMPYHSLFRALQVTPEQLAASDARLNAASSQAQIGSFNPPPAAFVMSGSKVLDRLPPAATQSNPA